jgi:NAD+ synthase
MLAKKLCVPDCIITKPPSAGLWDGQTDEDELGMSYEELDKCLVNYDSGKNVGVSPESYERVCELVQGSNHKRQMPPAPERKALWMP